MNRHAVLISNPGEQGADNYCRGVLKDVENYQSFLLSPIGGLWLPSEIVQMNRPFAFQVQEEVKKFSAYDYVLAIFTGHGWHSTPLDSTILELRDGQEIDSSKLAVGAVKQTIILDCCRVRHPFLPTVRALDEKLAKSGPAIHPQDCRLYFDQAIEQSPGGLVVMNSCSPGETAGDDDLRGGVYSYNLLRAGQAWTKDSTADTTHKVYARSVVEAHEEAAALVQRVRPTQTPHIEKPRSSPYYPFCIMA